MTEKQERKDDLEIQGLQIIQDGSKFCFGTDAVLLANFVKVRKHARVVDLGTGTGIIPLLLSAKTWASRIIGIEIQEDMVDMARRSVELNKLQDRVEILKGDIRALEGHLPPDCFDNVVSNPPYIQDRSGLPSSRDGLSVSRHEILCCLEDIFKAAAYLLKYKGHLTLVHRPHRLVDVLCGMRTHGIEPKRLRMVHDTRDASPALFLVDGVKGAGTWLQTELPLILRNGDGSYTREVLAMYRKTRE